MARQDSYLATMKIANDITDHFIAPLNKTFQKYLKRNGWQQFQRKDQGELIGVLDLEIQKAFLKFAEAQKIPVASEELSAKWPPKADRFWLLDPIDGTHCFAMGLPLFGVMAALIENGEVVFTSIFLPAEKMLSLVSHSPFDGFYFAGKDAGAYVCLRPDMRMNRLGLSTQTRLSQSLILLEGAARKMCAQPFANRLIRKCRTRHFGSSCWSTTRLALGGALGMPVDAVVAFNNKPWDTLPPSLLITKTGGRVTDFKGQPLTLENCADVIFSNGQIHEELLAMANGNSCACGD